MKITRLPLPYSLARFLRNFLLLAGFPNHAPSRCTSLFGRGRSPVLSYCSFINPIETTRRILKVGVGVRINFARSLAARQPCFSGNCHSPIALFHDLENNTASDSANKHTHLVRRPPVAQRGQPSCAIPRTGCGTYIPATCSLGYNPSFPDDTYNKGVRSSPRIAGKCGQRSF